MLRRAGVTGLLLAVLILFPVTPVQVSYVYSESMEPTIGQYDGYVVVPADTVKPGDIVVFWSSRREEHVTHRLVGQSKQGFITQGDNNDATDQAAGAPYVQREDIRGKVLTVREKPVIIPQLGVITQLLREYRFPILVFAGILLFGTLVLRRGNETRHRTRSLTKGKHVIRPLFVIALLGGTIAGGFGGTT